MRQWQRSAPEPGQDHSGIWSSAGVIILTGAGDEALGGGQKIRGERP